MSPPLGGPASRRAGIWERDSLRRCMEGDRDRSADRKFLGLAIDDACEKEPTLGKFDDRWRVRNLEILVHRSPHDGVAVDHSCSRTRLPDQRVRSAHRTDRRRCVHRTGTRTAALEAQFTTCAALPIGLGEDRRRDRRDRSGLGMQSGHGTSVPRTITSVNIAPEPPPVHMAISAPSTCIDEQVPRNC